MFTLFTTIILYIFQFEIYTKNHETAKPGQILIDVHNSVNKNFSYNTRRNNFADKSETQAESHSYVPGENKIVISSTTQTSYGFPLYNVQAQSDIYFENKLEYQIPTTNESNKIDAKRPITFESVPHILSSQFEQEINVNAKNTLVVNEIENLQIKVNEPSEIIYSHTRSKRQVCDDCPPTTTTTTTTTTTPTTTTTTTTATTTTSSPPNIIVPTIFTLAVVGALVITPPLPVVTPQLIPPGNTRVGCPWGGALPKNTSMIKNLALSLTPYGKIPVAVFPHFHSPRKR